MSDEKYVTLTEDEVVRALGEAKIAESNWWPDSPEAFAAMRGARALLEAARWFREHEHSVESQGVLICSECYGSPSDKAPHDATCTVGRWVRAAERAGL